MQSIFPAQRGETGGDVFLKIMSPRRGYMRFSEDREEMK